MLISADWEGANLSQSAVVGKVRGVNGPAQTTEATEREVLLTRPVVLVTLVAFVALFGFQLLLSVVPLYADEAGGGSSGAGLATAAFMLSTVLTQIQMPRILGRYGYRRTLAAGLLFLGIPALFYAYAQTLVPILAVTLVRGVGFGIITVVFAALIVELAPPGRTGEALAGGAVRLRGRLLAGGRRSPAWAGYGGRHPCRRASGEGRRRRFLRRPRARPTVAHSTPVCGHDHGRRGGLDLPASGG